MKPEQSVSNNETGFKLVFRAFRYRNYRLYFGGQGISLTGTWIQQIAMSWLVYRLTNSALLLGVVGFSVQIPAFLVSPFTGVVADRCDRRRILVATQTLAMIQALILSALVLTNTVAIWHIISLGIFLGLVNAFDMPIRQAFIVEIVDKKEDLGNAIALNSSMFNGARLIGPSIGGILIAVVGEGTCFFLNGLSYLAVIAALLAMNITHRKPNTKNTNVLQELREGFAYAFGFTPIKYIILLIGLVSLMGMPYMVLMPIFAKDILHGGPHTLGFLMGASGVGALSGAIYLASRKNVFDLCKIIAIATSIFSIGLVAFSLSRILLLSLLLMLLTGYSMVMQMVSSNTLLQTIVDDDKRGRVMSFYTMAFIGTAPFGSLLAGSLASKIGAPNTLLIGGIVCILGSLIFVSRLPLLRKTIRPIYARMGIVPKPSSELTG